MAAPSDRSPSDPSGSSAPRGGVDPDRPRSRLSTTALVLALMPCCPPVSLGGAVLGIVALHRHRQRPGAFRGEGLASSAVIVGTLLALLQLTLVNRMLSGVSDRHEVALTEAITWTLGSEPVEPETLASWWTGDAGVDAAAIDALRAATRDRYGSLLAVRPTGVRQLETGRLSVVLAWSVVLDFSEQDCPATVHLAVRTGPSDDDTLWPIAYRRQLVWMRLDGGEDAIEVGTEVVEPEGDAPPTGDTADDAARDDPVDPDPAG